MIIGKDSKLINVKSQKGSVTLLIAVLFFSSILLGVYNSNMNKLQAQDKDISRIQEGYDKDIDVEYEKTLKKLNS